MSDATKRTLNICTLGHQGHGKTTLTAALSRVGSEDFGSTKVEFDTINNAPDEKCGAATFKAAHVKYDSKQCHIMHVDCPHSTDYVKGFITGAIKVDGAILVCSADGPMPETLDHIQLCSQMGVAYIVVFLNKAEIVENADDLELPELEIRESLSKAGFAGDDALVIKGSALMAWEGKDDNKMGTTAVKKLLDALDSYTPAVITADKTPPQPQDHFEANVYILRQEEGGGFNNIYNYSTFTLRFLTSEVTGRWELPEDVDYVAAGTRVVVKVVLSQSIVIEKGQYFTLVKSTLTSGIGIVIK
ncbi:GTP-binding protein [Pseudomonas alliivorans]|nr:GTP-binding protein [Pseudomonas alliivorans]MEE4801409.1 GTP-binding protein [Pseudomonas alliivorans]